MSPDPENKFLQIVFYDGECGLCQRSVFFLNKHDKRRTLFFAPLGGQTAAKFLPASLSKKTDTVIYYDRGHLYFHSEAALRLLVHLFPLCKPFLILLFVPPFLRDAIYRLIAKNRKNFYSSCSVKQFHDLSVFLP